MKAKLIRNNKGIGLLEVLIGMAIIAIGLLGFAPLLVLSVEGNVIARENSDAANLLKEKLEYFEALDPMPTMPYKEEEQNLNGNYTRTTAILDHASDSLIPEGLYKIDVRVSWLDNQKVRRASSYSTFIVKS